jgi:hypothetical protein
MKKILLLATLAYSCLDASFSGGYNNTNKTPGPECTHAQKTRLEQRPNALAIIPQSPSIKAGPKHIFHSHLEVPNQHLNCNNYALDENAFQQLHNPQNKLWTNTIQINLPNNDLMCKAPVQQYRRLSQVSENKLSDAAQQPENKDRIMQLKRNFLNDIQTLQHKFVWILTNNKESKKWAQEAIKQGKKSAEIQQELFKIKYERIINKLAEKVAKEDMPTVLQWNAAWQNVLKAVAEKNASSSHCCSIQ